MNDAASLCASVVDYFAGGDGIARDDVREHLRVCDACATAHREDLRLFEALADPPPAHAPSFAPPSAAASRARRRIAAGILAAVALLGGAAALREAFDAAARSDASTATPPPTRIAGRSAGRPRDPARPIEFVPMVTVQTVVRELADGTAFVTRRVVDVDLERRELGEFR